MSKIVIALGGNALGNTPNEQKELVKIPAAKIAKLIASKHQVIVGHGNGPQVGMIYNVFSEAKKLNENAPIMPFAEAGGMSQGYIGYHMQTAIANVLKQQNLSSEVIYVLTQTLVDKNDTAFKNPTKPVGSFYKTIQDAKKANGDDAIIIEDSGRGYRKVVASPKPIGFMSIKAIKNIVDNGSTLIVGGGGGIPTIIDANGEYRGVDGVIDKDFALSKIAQLVDAELFIILTAVSQVYVNYNKPNQKALSHVNVSELEEYIVQNQFAPGSMLPKIQAAMEFVKGNNKRKAIIAKLEEVEAALESKTGTVITNL